MYRKTLTVFTKRPKTRLGKESYILNLGFKEKSGPAWFRLGAWKFVNISDDHDMRICPMCGNFEDEIHILGKCNDLEYWRRQLLPERFLNSNRERLACYELLVNPENWINLGKFLDKTRKIRTTLIHE
ncbi:hypothetical protein L9F63_001732 [Diploptera punctata]|uniref:Uncharacterized protein n=1 Tax=Diploptera punctata TaxID=6984 RepID=A0AAD8EIZ4_DIPPU|nr:hypothetical protein L9F63_001732 [Diploptera punctata]